MNLISRNPSKNYEILGEVEETTREEVLEKIKNAKKVQKDWADLELPKRIEVFGTILPVMPFKTIDEAIQLANDTIYGLGGYVFTTNKQTFEKVSKELKTGMVSCNNLAYSAPHNPFGGTKSSGLGRIRGKWGFRELCNIKIVTFEKQKRQNQSQLR